MLHLELKHKASLPATAFCFIFHDMKIEEEVQANLKFPKSLKDKLKAAAKENHRSMTAEVVARLESTFGDFRPYGEALNEGNTDEEARALRMRLSAMQEAMKALEQASTTMLGESQALSLEYQRVSRAAAEARRDKQKAGKDD
ncbi:Arc family DNA-binding protein [Halomonas sp.]|uniref:Arc family DNA-binding protein n=1 Tax=Halomonas sp. TaxID=1486246 RepID=UPI00298D631D|nr:Arc family DNA-binding protein [Halomonas sp.]MDW7746743.1 Arc family DNA-binding protein [Halomonas sp.]